MRTAEDLGATQRQEGSASKRPFTQAQQAVAAALMVVLKRAIKNGREAAIAAKQILISNNPATRPFLMMLPDDGKFPTMKYVEQRAPARLQDSLSLLADQCDLAGFQPLEVFTRSVQCTTHKAARESVAAKGEMHERMQQLGMNLQNLKPRLHQPSWAAKTVSSLTAFGLPDALAVLIVVFLTTFRLLQSDDYVPATPPLQYHPRADLDHLLPGGPLSRSPSFSLKRVSFK